MKLNAGMFSSERDDWNTPACVLERVRQLGAIALDPCSNEQSIVGAQTEWRLTLGHDGLREMWTWAARGGLVYVNPPYGDEIAKWAQKIALEATWRAEIVALLPARTDTAWFQDYVTTSQALCFWRGRLRFGAAVADQRQAALFAAEPALLEEPEEAAPFPSVLAYWGARAEQFEQIFRDAGVVLRRPAR